MVNKLVNFELPQKVWDIIDHQFKLNKESDADILCNIVRNYIAEHGFYPDIHSLTHGHGIKDYLDLHAIMIESLLELLDKKGLVPSKEFGEVMHQKVMKE